MFSKIKSSEYLIFQQIFELNSICNQIDKDDFEVEEGEVWVVPFVFNLFFICLFESFLGKFIKQRENNMKGSFKP